MAWPFSDILKEQGSAGKTGALGPLCLDVSRRPVQSPHPFLSPPAFPSLMCSSQATLPCPALLHRRAGRVVALAQQLTLDLDHDA